jgi:hypothetical protein
MSEENSQNLGNQKIKKILIAVVKSVSCPEIFGQDYFEYRIFDHD